MTRITMRLRLLCMLLASVVCLDGLRGHGEAQAARAPGPSAAQPAPSLKGPWLETGFGIGIVLHAPLFGAVATVFNTPGGFICDNQEDCDANARAQARTFRRVTIPLAVLGALLTIHGAYRVRQGRLLRRELVLSQPLLTASPDGSTLSGVLRF